MDRRDFLKMSSMTALLAAGIGRDCRKSLPNLRRGLKTVIRTGIIHRGIWNTETSEDWPYQPSVWAACRW